MRKITTLCIVLLSILIWSCDNRKVFEDQYDFENEYWGKNNTVTFQFEVKDRSTPYRLFSVIRNNTEYDFSNFYMRFALLNNKRDTINSDLNNYYLFNPKSGRPLGSGIGDIYEHKLILSDSFYFEQPGTYYLHLEQYMRRDSLKGILAAGMLLKTLK